MYTANNNMYLKFVTPENNWGTTGAPQYRVSVESDSCICPPNLTTPEALLDPYTNKNGYGCKLTPMGSNLLTLSQTSTTNGTTNGALYQLFYQKSIGNISCTSYRFKQTCLMSLTPLPIMAALGTQLSVNPPQILNGVAPYTYFWEITTQTGVFANYTFLSSNALQTPTIGALNGVSLNVNIGEISVKVTVADANGCGATSSGTYISKL
jgi:hypothetical protein